MVDLKYISHRFSQAGFSLIILLSIALTSFIGCSSANNDTPEVVKDPPVKNPPQETSTFKNPLLNAAPDPWVYNTGTEYLVTYTTGHNITLIKTKKMSDLKNGTKKVVWTPPATGLNSKEIWAPELHYINNAWYVYYAASDGNNINHKMWVLENTSEDPFHGVWKDKGELKLPDDKWAIDGTPFEINGKHYFLWSGWEGDVDVRQDIYIAEMENPTTVMGKRIKLLQPQDDWEINNTNPQVVEGPQFLLKDDKAFIFYSAGGCWDDGYSIGAMWTETTSDPMQANSWKRLDNNPLFSTNTSSNAYAPGHNSFFTSLNGDEDWILYHANPQPAQGCGDNRSMRMQEFSWTDDGFPVLGTPEPLNNNLNKPSGE